MLNLDLRFARYGSGYGTKNLKLVCTHRRDDDTVYWIYPNTEAAVETSNVQLLLQSTVEVSTSTLEKEQYHVVFRRDIDPLHAAVHAKKPAYIATQVRANAPATSYQPRDVIPNHVSHPVLS